MKGWFVHITFYHFVKNCCCKSTFNWWFLGSRKPISQHDLKAVTSDVTNAGNRTITFMIVTSPKLGRLIRVNSDNTTQEILSFTQSMVSIFFILDSSVVDCYFKGHPNCFFLAWSIYICLVTEHMWPISAIAQICCVIKYLACSNECKKSLCSPLSGY